MVLRAYLLTFLTFLRSTFRQSAICKKVSAYFPFRGLLFPLCTARNDGNLHAWNPASRPFRYLCPVIFFS